MANTGESTGARLSKQEAAYFNHLIYLLEENRPPTCLVKLKCCVCFIVGLLLGFALGTAPGCIIGGFVGLAFGTQWANGHARLFEALKGLPEDKRVRVVGLVQGVVGGSSDVRDVGKFIDNGEINKLLKALKQHLKIRFI